MVEDKKVLISSAFGLMLAVILAIPHCAADNSKQEQKIPSNKVSRWPDLPVPHEPNGPSLELPSDTASSAALYNWALIYLSSEKGNLDAALKWLRKAADKGSAEAQYDLGQAYYLGIGLPANAQEATKWWQRSAKNADSAARLDLGEAYFRGYGVARDPKQAVYWWQQAAKQKNEFANLHLWQCYMKGQGVPRDPKIAQQYYSAASQSLKGRELNNAKIEIERIHYFAERKTPPDYLNELLSTQDTHPWSKERFPLKVYIPAPKQPGGFDQKQRACILDCFAQWSKALGVSKLAKAVYSSSAADIIFTCDSVPDGISLGQTSNVSEDNIHDFSKTKTARIRLLKESNIGNDFRLEIWRSTCLHEIGHALGLGHSPYFDDCMFFRARIKELSPRDIATAKRLYEPLTEEAAKTIMRDEANKGNYFAQVKLGCHLATAHSAKGDYQEAANLWQKAAQQGYYEGWGKLAWAHANGAGVPQDPHLAFDECSKAITLSPNDVQVYFNRAEIYAQYRQYKLAIADCTKAIKLEPKNPQAYVNRGKINEQFGDYKGAIIDFNKAIELEPDCLQAYAGRGDALYQLGAYMKSIEDQKKVVSINSAYNAAENIAMSYLQLKQFPLAATYLVKAAETPDSANEFVLRGDANYRLGRYEKALSDATKAIELEPFEPGTYCNRGEAYLAMGKTKEAMKDFDKAIAMRGDVWHGEAYYFRAKVFEKLGQKKQAEADATMAKRLGFRPVPELPAIYKPAEQEAFPKKSPKQPPIAKEPMSQKSTAGHK